MRNLARPCHCSDTYRSRRMLLLCSSGKRPSKTGMEHWFHSCSVNQPSMKHSRNGQTCKISSMSRPAICFISDTFRDIVLMVVPKEGTSLKLESHCYLQGQEVVRIGVTGCPIHLEDSDRSIRVCAEDEFQAVSRRQCSTHEESLEQISQKD